jgi:hypothetical protein
MKLTANGPQRKWYIGASTQAPYYTASTIMATNTESIRISTATMKVNTLNLIELITIPYLPTSIPNCVLWLDAADASTYTNTGGTISAWRDKALGAVTTAEKGSGPTLSSINGLPAFYFNAGANIMAMNVTQSTTNRTFFMVLTSVSNDGAYIWPSGGRGWELQHYTSNTLVLSDQNVAYIQFSGTIPIGSPFIISITYAGNANTQFNVNGTGPGTFANQSSASSISADNTHFIGGSTGGFAATFRLGEMIEYNASLIPAQVQQVEGYLAQKWGITASLPEGHPGVNTQIYKSQRLGSTVGLSVSSSLAYWGPHLLNSGFRTAQPQVFFYTPPLISSALTYLPLATNSTDIGTLPQTVTTVGTVSYTTIGGKQTAYFTNNPNNYFRLPYVNQNTLTLCYWMYPADSGSYTSLSIAGLDLSTGTNANAVLQADIDNSSITIYTAMPTQWFNRPSGTTNGVGAWTHIAITINQTTYVQQLYINGSLASTATGTGSSISTRGYFYLGRSGDWGARAPNGYVRQFAFFGRVLSASEVSQIYNSTG